MRILIESITKFTFRGWVIRIWQEEKELTFLPHEKINMFSFALKKYNREKDDKLTIQEAAKYLLSLKDVNAVEITPGINFDETVGVVLYKDWP